MRGRNSFYEKMYKQYFDEIKILSNKADEVILLGLLLAAEEWW